MRVGIVGAGPWAREAHIPALQQHKDTELVGVWVRDVDSARDLAVTVFSDYRALLDQCDAIAFAVPPAVQVSLAIEAARAGKHLILDKPVAENLFQAQELADAIDLSKVYSIIFLTRRFAPETKVFLEKQESGNWVAGQALWLSGALLGGRFSHSPWRQCHGAILDVGPHIFDLIDLALGRIVNVVAAHHEKESDTWSVHLQHENYRGETNIWSTVHMSMRTVVSPSILRVMVHGSGGVIELADRSCPPIQCYHHMLEEFYSSIAQGQAHSAGIERGVYLQGIIAAVMRAAQDPV